MEEFWAKHAFWMQGIDLDESTDLGTLKLVQKLGEKCRNTPPFSLGMLKQPIFYDIDKSRIKNIPSQKNRPAGPLSSPSGLTLIEKQHHILGTVRVVVDVAQ